MIGRNQVIKDRTARGELKLRVEEYIKQNPSASAVEIHAHCGGSYSGVAAAAANFRKNPKRKKTLSPKLNGSGAISGQAINMLVEAFKFCLTELQQGKLNERYTKSETLAHYRSALVIHAEQAADLAEMFYASIKEVPSAITDEARSGVYRAAEAWKKLEMQIKEEKENESD